MPLSFPTMVDSLTHVLPWSLPESNRRPVACKATALPTELRPLERETGVEPATFSLEG